MASTIDFRKLDEGFGGKTYKRKRQESEASITITRNDGASAADMEIDVDTIPPLAKRSALPSADNPDKPAASLGNPSYDGVIAGKVSGRKWKQPRTHRASAKHVSVKGKSLEEREREKEIKKAYKERINELKEEIRQNKIEKRKKREEREKKKKENILRSGTKLQIISNPKTLQKISKSKQKKLLKVVPNELLNKNKKKK
ncbi:hypothetical protein HS088_TW04G00620 [Tripterygium wilfordii]|uniref:Coiled-coil domain-containing protein 86 n=1 Tax=Tripterygium wilfordii TaxID=458696 RepID=A0A7J7DQI1_TRIWF|nr:protein PXR1 [Tripterygium wilfordii]KAF5748662.1 hypothetical protein HS088_TW04G00620 [Tripterygium wilfordii]